MTQCRGLTSDSSSRDVTRRFWVRRVDGIEVSGENISASTVGKLSADARRLVPQLGSCALKYNGCRYPWAGNTRLLSIPRTDSPFMFCKNGNVPPAGTSFSVSPISSGFGYAYRVMWGSRAKIMIQGVALQANLRLRMPLYTRNTVKS